MGLAVAMAALAGLGQLDREHAAAYFQIIYNALREPMQKALERWSMERQTEAKATFPPFAQLLIERGKLEGKRETLLRLLGRAGITLSEDEKARVSSCTDTAVLDRWLDNAFGAKTTADVFS